MRINQRTLYTFHFRNTCQRSRLISIFISLTLTFVLKYTLFALNLSLKFYIQAGVWKIIQKIIFTVVWLYDGCRSEKQTADC